MQYLQAASLLSLLLLGWACLASMLTSSANGVIIPYERLFRHHYDGSLQQPYGRPPGFPRGGRRMWRRGDIMANPSSADSDIISSFDHDSNNFDESYYIQSPLVDDDPLQGGGSSNSRGKRFVSATYRPIPNWFRRYEFGGKLKRMFERVALPSALGEGMS